MNQNRDDSDKVQEVIHAERCWLKAHLELDIAALDAMMAEEYLLVNPQGALIPKHQVLATFAAGTRHWDQVESDEYQIRVYGNLAVVIGRWRAKGVTAGQSFDYTARYVSTWIWRDQRWQMLTDQSTEMPATSTIAGD